MILSLPMKSLHLSTFEGLVFKPLMWSGAISEVSRNNLLAYLTSPTALLYVGQLVYKVHFNSQAWKNLDKFSGKHLNGPPNTRRSLPIVPYVFDRGMSHNISVSFNCLERENKGADFSSLLHLIPVSFYMVTQDAAKLFSLLLWLKSADWTSSLSKVPRFSTSISAQVRRAWGICSNAQVLRSLVCCFSTNLTLSLPNGKSIHSVGDCLIQ